jgi:hypothetical protein
LTVITVNTGLVTAVVAIVSLILVSVHAISDNPATYRFPQDETASGTDFWTAIAQYPQCSIYLSAFLANLNARRYISGADGEGVTISNIEDIRFASTPPVQRGDVESSMVTTTAGRSDHIVLGSGGNSSGTDGQYTTTEVSVSLATISSTDPGINLQDRSSNPEKYSHPIREL